MFASVSERAAKFQDLGGALGLKAGALETIRSDHDNTKDRLGEVIKQWLFRENIKSKESDKPTWRALVIAMADPNQEEARGGESWS